MGTKTVVFGKAGWVFWDWVVRFVRQVRTRPDLDEGRKRSIARVAAWFFFLFGPMLPCSHCERSCCKFTSETSKSMGLEGMRGDGSLIEEDVAEHFSFKLHSCVNEKLCGQRLDAFVSSVGGGGGGGGGGSGGEEVKRVLTREREALVPRMATTITFAQYKQRLDAGVSGTMTYQDFFTFLFAVAMDWSPPRTRTYSRFFQVLPIIAEQAHALSMTPLEKASFDVPGVVLPLLQKMERACLHAFSKQNASHAGGSFSFSASTPEVEEGGEDLGSALKRLLAESFCTLTKQVGDTSVRDTIEEFSKHLRSSTCLPPAQPKA
jgi:hypothetical protein